jgi:hypothetical protein
MIVDVCSARKSTFEQKENISILPKILPQNICKEYPWHDAPILVSCYVYITKCYLSCYYSENSSKMWYDFYFLWLAVSQTGIGLLTSYTSCQTCVSSPCLEHTNNELVVLGSISTQLTHLRGTRREFHSVLFSLNVLNENWEPAVCLAASISFQQSINVHKNWDIQFLAFKIHGNVLLVSNRARV